MVLRYVAGERKSEGGGGVPLAVLRYVAGERKSEGGGGVPLAVLRELLRNALAHRLYENSSRPVIVLWFRDRVEIHSPSADRQRQRTT